MAVTLGKDCTFSGGGILNSSVRETSLSFAAREIETSPFGVRAHFKYPIGYEAILEVEVVEDPDLYNALRNGTVIDVTSTAISGRFFIANISRNEPLDDIVTVKLTLKQSKD